MAKYTSDIRHVAVKENVVANYLSKPPDVLSLPRSTKVADVKVPSGSSAASVARDGSQRASNVPWAPKVLYCISLFSEVRYMFKNCYKKSKIVRKKTFCSWLWGHEGLILPKGFSFLF